MNAQNTPSSSSTLSSHLTTKSILLAPGPVQLHPEVQKILALPMIHHRTPEFDQVLKSVLQKLKFLFQTKNDVFILSSTGSGGMEALLINVLKPGAHVLCVISGKFGERWAEMVEVFGGHAHKLNVEWGSAVAVQDVKKYLADHPEIDIVLTQACETSTATTHPIRELAEVVAKTRALFLVDAITALGAFDIQMDNWNIDGLVAGSQKAIMLPTGLSLVSFSEKAWKQVEANPTPRYYFDLRKEKKSNAKGETFFSSNVSLIRALYFVLTEIESSGGLPKLFQTIHRRAEYTRKMAHELGLSLYSKSPSDSVTALNLPAYFDGAKFREYLEAKYQVTVMGGQDQLKGKIIRLGHMGYLTDEDLHQTTLRMAKALNDFNLQASQNDSSLKNNLIDLEKLQQLSSEWLNKHVI